MLIRVLMVIVILVNVSMAQFSQIVSGTIYEWIGTQDSAFRYCASGATVHATGQPDRATDNLGYYTINVNTGWSGIITVTYTGNTKTFYAYNIPPVTKHTYCYVWEKPDYCIIRTEIPNMDSVQLHYSGSSDTLLRDSVCQKLVPVGWSGYVTPSKRGYLFSPESLHSSAHFDSAGHRTDLVSFTATQIVIQGTVLDAMGNGISGVSIGGVTTGSDGHYTVTDTTRPLVIEPVKSGFQFTKSCSTITDLSMVHDINFVGQQIVRVLPTKVAILNSYSIVKGYDVFGKRIDLNKFNSTFYLIQINKKALKAIRVK